MKKIITLLLSLISFSAYSMETNIMALADSPHGRSEHHFDSISTHSFYIHNEDKVIHVYYWVMKQCALYDGTPSNCPADDSGKVILNPGEIRQFGHFLKLDLYCTESNFRLGLYAESTLRRDDGKRWMAEDFGEATCD